MLSHITLLTDQHYIAFVKLISCELAFTKTTLKGGYCREEMFQKEIRIQKDEAQALAAIIRLPEETGYFPSVILCHGWNPERKRDLLDALSLQLTYAGFATLMFDFSGHGESEGKFETTTVTQMKKDLQMAWDFFSTHPNVDPKQQFLLGHSIGGMVAALTSPYLSNLKAFVSISAHSDFKQSINSYFNDYEQQEWRQTGMAMLRGRYPLHKSVLLDMLKHNLTETVGAIQCPTLIVHGTADMVIPVEQARILYSLLPQPELAIIEGADHQFSDPNNRTEMIQTVVSWLKAKL
jgi:uncharacterized protein